MTKPCATAPHVRPRQSLSARLWLLATLAVLLSEIVVFLPYIAHERTDWLKDRIEDASIAVLTASDSSLDAAKRDEILRLARVEWIRCNRPDGTDTIVGRETAATAAVFDLRRTNLFAGINSALAAILRTQDRLVRVVAESPFNPGILVEVVVHERGLGDALRQFARDFAGISLLVAGVTGGLVYLAVLVLLVRPMRRITGSIAAFRADPERTAPLDPDDVTGLRNDEIAVAGRELAAMQHELRAALWRNARLAALGTVVAKVSHDLRGILTPALLVAERLQFNPDPKVQRAGHTLVQAVDRATDLVRRTLDYAREGPPPLALAPVELAPLVDEAAQSAKPAGSDLRVENAVDPAVVVKADRNQMFRILVNLLRNAAEAGARNVRVSVRGTGPYVLDVQDDGPGLPESVRANLFCAFAASVQGGGTGLGLAIARDLMVAHGGTIELLETGPTGTTFRLTLPAAESSARTAVQPDSARMAPATPADVLDASATADRTGGC
jgi:signal transduction histidine kinase